MAEEPEHLKGSIAGQTLEVSVRDLVPILLLLLGGLGGYLVYLSIDHRFQQIETSHFKLFDYISTRDTALANHLTALRATCEGVREDIRQHDRSSEKEP